jgi:aryl-alcohol dehydrogenase-like predicted oxidoreductase
VVEALGRVADARGIPYAQVAMAWLLHKPGVTSPIIGATRVQHVLDAVSAIDVRLSQDEILGLQEPYVPHEVSGFGASSAHD